MPKETTVLTQYLPKKLSEVELKGIIQYQIIAQNLVGPSDMGKIMKYLLTNYHNQYDGKQASSFANALLTEHQMQPSKAITEYADDYDYNNDPIKPITGKIIFDNEKYFRIKFVQIIDLNQETLEWWLSTPSKIFTHPTSNQHPKNKKLWLVSTLEVNPKTLCPVEGEDCDKDPKTCKECRDDIYINNPFTLHN